MKFLYFFVLLMVVASAVFAAPADDAPEVERAGRQRRAFCYDWMCNARCKLIGKSGECDGDTCYCSKD